MVLLQGPKIIRRYGKRRLTRQSKSLAKDADGTSVLSRRVYENYHSGPNPRSNPYIDWQLMSWAAHNPEVFTEILERAVTEKLCKEANVTPTDAEWGFLKVIVSNLMESHIKHTAGAYQQFDVTDALIDWANKEISEHESAYWSRGK